MGFRKTQTIKRLAPGSYVDGIFTPGAETSFTIQASVQPLRDDEIKNLPEGRRASDVVKLYTISDLLTVEDKGANQQPDRLVWRGEDYELSSKSVRSMDVLNHMRYYATRVPVSG